MVHTEVLRGVYEYIKEHGMFIWASKAIRKVFYKSDSRLSWKINDYNEKVESGMEERNRWVKNNIWEVVRFSRNYVRVRETICYQKTN